MLLLVLLIAFVGVPALVLHDEYQVQMRDHGAVSSARMVSSLRQAEVWKRPFLPALVQAQRRIGQARIAVSGLKLPDDARSAATTVSEALQDKRVRPAHGRDEEGRRRRLTTYLGEFDWRAAERGARVDVSSSPVEIWLVQLARFSYDHGKVRTKDPTWQSVARTWSIGRGVCRDSATLLTDWLIHHRHDAAMALGMVSGPGWPGGGGGHAWTVLRVQGIDYILESTNASRHSRMRTPPRAQFETDYWPTYLVRRGGDSWHPDVVDSIRPPSMPSRRLFDYREGWRQVTD